jgi:transcriptional regulator with XRE-family HTH domain
MTSIGERLYDLRNRNNMSQGNLADKLDVSRQTISKWENNICLPEAEKLLQLSEIFGVSIDYIMKGETITEPEPVYIYVKDPESNTKYNDKVIRKYAGAAIAVICGLLTLIFILDSSIFILLTAPLTILGILMATNIKHPWLIASWIIYIVGVVALPFFTAISPLTIFYPVTYTKGYTLHLLWSWSIWIALAVLTLCTIKAKRGYIFKKKQ